MRKATLSRRKKNISWPTEVLRPWSHLTKSGAAKVPTDRSTRNFLMVNSFIPNRKLKDQRTISELAIMKLVIPLHFRLLGIKRVKN